MTEDVTPRGKVLREAEDLITGDRNKTYGSPTQNFQNTADIWNVLLGHKFKDGEKITATEVANLMIGLKLARTVAQAKRDNFVDIAGYAACGWETIEDAEPKPLTSWQVSHRSRPHPPGSGHLMDAQGAMECPGCVREAADKGIVYGELKP